MPKEIYQILGQVSPVASTETTLYTVPRNRSAIVTIHIYPAAAGPNVDVAIVPDGGAASPPATVAKNLILNGMTMTPNIKEEIKGITLNEFDQIRVEADSTPTTFHVYGVELEP